MPSKANITIVSVVRNQATFRRCVAENPNCAGCRIMPFDNSVKNENITTIYNRALNQIEEDEQQWIIFCHEDFEAQSEWQVAIAQLDTSNVYGPAGARYTNAYGFIPCRESCGVMTHSNKDGSDKRPSCANQIKGPTFVDTLDCSCLIVHSGTTKKYRLRFDEKLSFDLYAEDFCIQAMEQHGIRSIALPLNAHHWSAGNLVDRYFRQLAYLNSKWPHSTYAAMCSVFVGGAHSYKRLMSVLTTIGTRNLIKNFFTKIAFALRLSRKTPFCLNEKLLKYGVMK